MSIQVGIYGKHPAFGDFVTAGLPQASQDLLESWLHRVLPQLRDLWGDQWQAAFDAAPVMMFWIGPGLTAGDGALCGVMGPSRDTVGRRFPLLAGVAGSGQRPPVLDADPALYTGLLQSLGRFVRGEGTGAVDFHHHLNSDMRDLIPEPDEAGDPGFWAQRQDGDVARLWSDVAAADHLRAAAGRCYLWCGGAGGAALHVTPGLPGAEELAWLMTSTLATPEPATLPQAQDAPQSEVLP